MTSVEQEASRCVGRARWPLHRRQGHIEHHLCSGSRLRPCSRPRSVSGRLRWKLLPVIDRPLLGCVDYAGAQAPARTVPAPQSLPSASSAFAAHERGGHMPTGTVKWFNDDKGYGFITPSDGAKDLFVHQTDIVSDGFRSLAEGANVSFDTGSGDKGPKAINVQAQ